MAERLKDRFFTDDSIDAFARVLEDHHPSFDGAAFRASTTASAIN